MKPYRKSNGIHPRGNGTLFQNIITILTFIVIALLLTAFHLTQQLAHHRQPALLTSPITIQKGGSANTQVSSKSKPSTRTRKTWPKLTYDPANTPSVTRSSGVYANNRVYCMVPFVWREDFYEIIMNTWGKRCDQIYFFTDSIVALDAEFVRDFVIAQDGEKYKPYWEYPEGTFPDNVIFINMTRSWDGCTDNNGKPKICRHIWEKMWRSWVYVGGHHLDRAEWFCKIDYDTFFFPENLQYYVHDYKHWDPKMEHHYFGHKLYHRNGAAGIIAGPCACWSHKTMEGIADVYRNMPKGHLGPERGKCEDRNGATEEVSTSLCLKKELGVVAEEAIDDQHRDFVMLDPYENQLGWNRTKQGEWWFWKGKEKNRGQMEECCAHRPIAIHKYKFPGEHRRLEQEFYGPEGKENKDLWRMKAVNRRYVDKVRKAMGIK
ncbi:hypothetical protein HJC23_005115 [Cyclotella cryptica]|uniref:Uncharacterized protein n=1 Tax=Cyclotella cryptica TaxID=29204 RepID=A0ABD3QGL9_9STRA|eukprot:CCRYP_005808-RA/>CCRYP_005808-RA protein AED:0.12 eAED:0.12 QI:0/-1/0/1/-1/1/1/0/432